MKVVYAFGRNADGSFSFRSDVTAQVNHSKMVTAMAASGLNEGILTGSLNEMTGYLTRIKVVAAE